MVAFFAAENLFQKDFGGIGRLCTELKGTKRERFVAFIKNIFKRFKNAMSEMGKLERKFLKLYDTVGKNKNTTSKSDVKNMLTGVDRDSGVAIIDLTNENKLNNIVSNIYGSKKYKIIAKYILDVLSEQPVTLSDGRKAVVDKSDASHIANASADKKTAEISKIKEIIEKAVLYAKDETSEHNKFKAFYYYKVNVKFGKETFAIYLNVGQTINDGTYHIYDITKKIRDTADRINGLERPEGLRSINSISTNIISDSSENVKENAKVKNPDVKNLLLGNENALMDDGSYFDIDENDELTILSAEQYQRELKKNPKLAVFDKRQIELKAKAIAKMYGSKASQKHIAEELLWIYNNIKNVDESGNTAKPRATALANEIFEYMVEESEQGDIFDELRAFFKHNPTVYDESLIDEFSSDWGEFIRKFKSQSARIGF